MLRKLSVRNAKRQAKDYLIYFLTVVMSVSLLYAFNTLVFSDQINQLSEMMSSLAAIVVVASVAIVLIIGWLVSYMTRFMLKKRSRELGTYMLLGIETQKVAKMFFIENLIIGAGALILGFVFGTLLSQVFHAVALNAYGVPYQFQLNFVPTAVGLTILYFSGIFLFALLKSKRKIAKMNIHDLVYYDRQNEVAAAMTGKKRGIIFVVSCIMGITALAVLIRLPHMNTSSGGTYTFLASLLVTGFLYGFYSSVSSFLVLYFDKHKTRKYKGNRLFLFRGFTSKISTMSVTMATLSLLFAVAIVGVGFGLLTDKLMEYYTGLVLYDLQISSDYEEMDLSPYLDYARENIPKAETFQYPVYESEDDRFTRAAHRNGEDVMVSHNDYYLGQSDYAVIRKLLDYPEIALTEDQFLIHCDPMFLSLVEEFLEINNTLTIDGKQLTLAGIQSEEFDLGSIWDGHGYRISIIVPDNIATSMPIALRMLAVSSEEKLSIDHYNNMLAIADVLAEERNALEGTDEEEYWNYDNIASQTQAQETKATFSVLMSMPLFYVSFIVMITAITILATQQLSDGASYRYQYRILGNLGMSRKKIARTLRKQMLIYFVVPVIPSILFGSLVTCCFGSMMGNGSLFTFSTMAFTIGITLLVFLFIYIVYFLASYASFKRAVVQ